MKWAPEADPLSTLSAEIRRFLIEEIGSGS
jgi:hypothetical protein